MTRYFDLLEHANTTDEEELVYKITSSEGEPKTVENVLLTNEVNTGYFRIKVERETLTTHRTGEANLQNFLKIPVEEELAVGDSLKLTLENETAGTNAEVYGLVEYSIR